MTSIAMTLNPYMEANVFHLLGYATSVGEAVKTGSAHLKVFWYSSRLDAGLTHLLSGITTGEFDPKQEYSREMADMLSELHNRLQSALDLADNRRLFAHPVHGRWFATIKAKTEKIGDIAESWELALNPKFHDLINSANRLLDVKGKVSSNWRSSLANMRY